MPRAWFQGTSGWAVLVSSANPRSSLADNTELLQNGASNKIVNYEAFTSRLVESREKHTDRIGRLKDVGQVETVTPRHR